MSESVIRLRGPGVDKYGDPVIGTISRKTITGCAIADGHSMETLASGRDATVSDFLIFAPDGSDVLSTDQLMVRGRLCNVVGDPFTWVSPFTGWRPGVVISANAAKG